ncbi:hypothetical protein HPB52_022205 [Rhipicephalus sanguineus]|uniref:Fucosyltransferase n=1 Tax=Rhipicephalus sanguineus TaxID=34632 RepID=A0A9D4SRM4_RHISA|nr:hypothetical protein HPB52_022205 [Rhipicephalus sanguineus]
MMENPKSIEYVDLNPVRDIFNWTMTYRSDSDVYVPYGRTVDHGTKPAATKRDMKALWKTKSRTAVWLISDCLSYSGRKNFSRELQQYMDVDVYGKCGPRDFPKTGVNASYEHFERNYHFILTFEDSICAEYVTEKLFTALKYDIVPVVFGGANYSRIAPRHFYIDAFAFESFEKLAEYLVALSRNYTDATKFILPRHQSVVAGAKTLPFVRKCAHRRRKHGAALMDTAGTITQGCNGSDGKDNEGAQTPRVPLIENAAPRKVRLCHHLQPTVSHAVPKNTAAVATTYYRKQ